MSPVEEQISKESIQKALIASLAKALYMNQRDVDIDKQFIDMGLDSIVGVEWVQAINKRYEMNLTATKVYDYPNIQEMAEFVKKELANKGTGSIQHTVPGISSPRVEGTGSQD